MIITGKKVLKTVTIALTIAVLFVGGAVTFFVTTLDQEKVKKQVIQMVHDQTSRELKIGGEVSWLFFPALGIKLHKLSLTNPPNFKNDDFAKIGAVSIRVKLLPLIFGYVRVNHLILKDVELQLIVSGSGASNWQGLMAGGATGDQEQAQHHQVNLAKFTLDRVEIDNGKLFWQNQQTKKELKINTINLHGQELNFFHPFGIEGSFDLLNFGSLVVNQGKVKAEVRLDVDSDQYLFKNLQWFGKLNHIANTEFFDFDGSGDLKIDLKEPQVAIDNFKLRLVDQPDIIKANKFGGAIELTMWLIMQGTTTAEMLQSLSGGGEFLIDHGSYQGVDVAYEVRRAQAVLNNQQLPEKTLQRTNFDRLTMSFKISNGLLRTNDLLVQANDYKVTGSGKVDLRSDRINLVCNIYSANDQSFLVPIKITGDFTDPSVSFNVAVLVGHAVTQVVKKVIQQPVEQLQKYTIPQSLKKILLF